MRMLAIRNAKWITLIGLAVAIKLFSFFPAAVERYYSTGIYPGIALVLRAALGWVPFSVGDLVYLFALIWLLIRLVRVIRQLAGRQLGRQWWIRGLRKLAAAVLILYVTFNMLWGLNYDRLGVAFQLQLNPQPYTNVELQNLVELIVQRLNQLDSMSRVQRPELQSKRFVFSAADRAYQSLGLQDSRFVYRVRSVKPSLYSYLGNYLGFAGYYNPFSGEAQVNTTIPVFTQPFTSCHEMGHQLGYAQENEANFAGYMATKSSPDPAVRYSVYFDLYQYAASELYLRDSTRLIPLRAQLHHDIRMDYQELVRFNRRYQNPLEPLIQKLYGRYLRANNQPQGIMTYDEVTGLVMAYCRKYGKAAF